jgi:hypothetical protein
MNPGKSAVNGAAVEAAKPHKNRNTAAVAPDTAAQQATGAKKKRKRGERGGESAGAALFAITGR